ncbi:MULTISPECIES: hypothetical protein [Ferrimicrobium]|jgi:hypothetical protein|uniref:hypothetical protein n=1 Tax=Ferrimicrobium TaxID=121038 RepID=UPI0023EFA304|nr:MULTISPECIES: hypothetical protein [Ferrimicrobium]
MRFIKRKSILGALAGGASLAMLALTATGYSAWSSSLPVVESISTISGIPAPTNVAIAHKSGTYTITWDIPSGASYGGAPIAQSFEIQGSSTGKSGTWSTIATVSGTTDSYSTAATSSISYYRVVTVDNGWVSSYSGGTAAPPTGIPAPATTITTYQLESVPVITTTDNTPPNYCRSEYACSVSAYSAVGSSGNGLYSGGGATGYDPALTYSGASDSYTVIQNWSYYFQFDDGQPVYAYYQGTMTPAPHCVPGQDGCRLPSGLTYFVGGGYTLSAGESIYGYLGTYQPECATYNASNSTSYLNSCVYPWDPSYTPTTTTTTYQWEEVPVTTTIN